MHEPHPKREAQQRTWAKIVAQAWADPEFRARLLADPAAVLKEAGLDMPDGVTLRVMEDTASLTHVVLPAVPDSAEIGEQLDARIAPFCCGVFLCTDACCGACDAICQS